MQVLFSSLAGDTLLAVLVGALFAVLSYSSLAAVLLTSTLAGAGLTQPAGGTRPGDRRQHRQRPARLVQRQPAAGPARRVALGNLLYKLAGPHRAAFLVPLVAWMDTLGYSAQTQVIGFHLVYNSLRCLPAAHRAPP